MRMAENLRNGGKTFLEANMLRIKFQIKPLLEK
jgi:hypothetical protein